MRISVCSPVHNEEHNLRRLVEEIRATMTGRYGEDWEQVLVDDGSTDGSAAVVRDLAARHHALRLISHPQNRGERAAWSTAFRNASGDILVMLAADLQNEPRDIPRLVDVVCAGEADCCTGARRGRRDAPFYRCATRILSMYVTLVYGVHVRDVSSSFFAVRACHARGLRLVHNDHRYILAIFRRRGARIREIETTHRARQAGRSHYTRWKVLRALPELLAFTRRFFGGFYDRHPEEEP